LHNGGPNGDLYCAKDTTKPWKAKEPATYYNKKAKPDQCEGYLE
jgi:hypothetical protein